MARRRAARTGHMVIEVLVCALPDTERLELGLADEAVAVRRVGLELSPSPGA